MLIIYLYICGTHHLCIYHLYNMAFGGSRSVVLAMSQWLGIRGTQVKSSGNKNQMSSLRSSDGAYFSEASPSWHVRPMFSLIVIVNYKLFCIYQLVGKG